MMDGVAKSDEVQRVGRAVAARRGELGLTQQELADDAGVDIKTVYNLESGARWPIAKNRAALAVALRWEPDGLAVIAAGEVPATPPPDGEPAPGPHLAVVPSPSGTAGRIGEQDRPAFLPLPEDERPAAVSCYWETEARAVAAALAEADRRGISLDAALAEVPDGSAVFPDPDMEQERAWWDAIKSRGLPSGPYSYKKLAEQIAILRVYHDRGGTGEANAGSGLAVIPRNRGL
jgi:DNA-binding XRE family transcriptional regulator